MKKALIIFGSTTGNTETMSENVQQALVSHDMDVDIQAVTDVTPEALTGPHDVVLLGCPAYGDEEIELQEDFEEFYDKMDGIKLDGKKFAVFAPGDSSYEHFCGSVDMLAEKMSALGGELVAPGLKIDGDPDDAIDDTREWADSIAGNL